LEQITEYYDYLLDTIRHSGWIVHKELSFRQIDDKEAYIRGELWLFGGLVLHIAEYVVIRKGKPDKDKYRYQLLDNQNNMIARWDNAPHHPEIPTHPYHKHLKDGKITSSSALSISDVLDELDDVLKDLQNFYSDNLQKSES